MGRLQNTFDGLQRDNKRALVAYLTACDPDERRSIDAAMCVIDHGADVVEVGVPFSDASADGPVIQRAMGRALGNGASFDSSLRVVRAIRHHRPTTPLVLFGYLNPIEVRGWARALDQVAEAGADAMLLVDVPLEESARLAALAAERKIDWVSLIAPTSGAERAQELAATATGFVYMISLTGVTGGRFQGVDRIRPLVQAVRRSATIPICVGFGVTNRETAAAAAELADGVVVGSALVDALERTDGGSLDGVRDLMRDIRSGVDAR